ncbi:hypothetical protein CONLIGDRAFT_426388 [Coniochaeta ligniaria NRRL 30616]|uniref:Uncharacterized protein n=1 Tax=Coniochaeta ligniaria NRRL 30616 TaxID=1408157 RepID=A0A1J7J224_9PEZI|nr:hypothetical protein CONLIGDRAFT_426388 [Coniochaeta ligniaria NRRL 30616]
MKHSPMQARLRECHSRQDSRDLHAVLLRLDLGPDRSPSILLVFITLVDIRQQPQGLDRVHTAVEPDIVLGLGARAELLELGALEADDGIALRRVPVRIDARLPAAGHGVELGRLPGLGLLVVLRRWGPACYEGDRVFLCLEGLVCYPEVSATSPNC